MDEDKLASAQKLFAEVFRAAASDLSEMVEVAQRVVDDAFDMRPVLQLAEDSSSQVETKKFISTLRIDYDKVIGLLSQAAGRIGSLITHFNAARYTGRLEEARAAIGNTPPPRPVLDEMVRMAIELQAGMLKRHMHWSAFLLNFANLVRSVDGAHSIILKRPSRLEKYKTVAKAGMAFAAGRLVTGFGVIVALAKSQEPDIDKMLDKMSEGMTTVDQLFSLRALLSHELMVAEYTLTLIGQAEDSEAEFLDRFDHWYEMQIAHARTRS